MLQCKKGHKNIIEHKLTYNPTIHILKRKEKKTNKQTKTNMTKLNVVYLFKKINIRTSSNFKGELVP